MITHILYEYFTDENTSPALSAHESEELVELFMALGLVPQKAVVEVDDRGKIKLYVSFLTVECKPIEDRVFMNNPIQLMYKEINFARTWWRNILSLANSRVKNGGQ